MHFIQKVRFLSISIQIIHTTQLIFYFLQKYNKKLKSICRKFFYRKLDSEIAIFTCKKEFDIFWMDDLTSIDLTDTPTQKHEKLDLASNSEGSPISEHAAPDLRTIFVILRDQRS